MNSNVLICLNQLDIGGIETAVINQATELLGKGYNVFILAKYGVYTEIMQKRGANCIDFTYTIKDGYDLEKANEVINIIKQYNIGQVHIHQIDCISSVFPACLKLNIPYIAYSHTGIMGTYEWFEKNYIGYKIILNNYFNMAEKIITITESAKEEIKNRYNLSDDKCIILNNSINFDDKLLNKTVIPNKIKKFLIVSRFAKEKLISIKNAIEIFKQYKKLHPKAVLTIVGTGPYEKEIEKQVEDIRQSVYLLGPSNDVISIMKENDVIIGVDRCILEAISVKRLAVVSGYENISEIVKPDNIQKASIENFSGRKLNNSTIDQIVAELSKLSKKEIKDIVTYNYNFAYENLNIKKNIFILSERHNIQLIDKSLYCEDINMLINEAINSREEKEKIYLDCKEAQNYFENQIQHKDKCIDELKKQLDYLNAEKEEINSKYIALQTELDNKKNNNEDY